MYENNDNFVPMIWEGDQHTSPNYSVRYAEYGIAALPSTLINGDTPDVGGGAAAYSRYQNIYNSLIDVASPMEIEVGMNVVEGEVEVSASVEMTDNIEAATAYRLVHVLTYYYEATYNSTVVAYSEEEFNLTTTGETGEFVQNFAIDPAWDLAKVVAISFVQHVETTGTATVSGYTFNKYPVLQAGYTGYPLSAVEPIEDITLSYGSSEEFDLTNYFAYNGEAIDIPLEVNSSDQAVATVSLDGNLLTVSAGSVTGQANITISGSYEGYTAADIFSVSTYDPNTVPVTFNLFDSYGDGWGYGGNSNYINIDGHEITLESGSEGSETIFLLPGDYDYTYTAADNWGSENSWTINLADGTEIGSGEGGANGVYDYAVTVPGDIASGTLSGTVSLSGEGDLSAVEISVGGNTFNPDAEGYYSLDIYPDTYMLTANLEGYDQYEMEVEILDGEETVLDFELIAEVSAQEEIVFVNSLQGNYPNPFNPTTTINYSLAQTDFVTLDIFNSKGQKVRTLVQTNMAAGEHSIVWNGEDNRGSALGSGVYFYTIKTADFSANRKMILLK